MEGVSAPPKKGPGLYDFLVEAELQQYFNSIKNQLKLSHPSQLKFVTESDLAELGMSKPEARRLRKYYEKHFPHNYLSKFKRLLSTRKPEPPSLYSVPPGSPKESDGSRPPRVPSKHIIPPDSITVNKELGMGEFGIVQQGVWSNEGERIQVAIKCLARERMQNNPIEFLKEAAIMHSIDHSHIVRLYGVVLDTDSLMLVTELAPLRSLLECLKEPSLRLSFPVLTLCDFAMQVCDGMQYLEAKRLIHRDLAARNILVFSKNKVKISDFGLSRALGQGRDYYQSKFNVNLKLPIAWCAPECISYLRFTSASDVWAFGVCLWEMFSYGFQPWAALTGHQILEAIDEPNLQRLEQPDCCPQEYYALMRDCWRHEALARPRFSELYTRLADIRPEQVQAKIASPDGAHLLPFRVGDVVTVLDKISHQPLWKGVVASGKTGLFNPANVVTYLGNLPSARPEPFQRSDSRSSSRRKLRTEMISGPQGDFKHTGHVGLDGAFFGDISFLSGSKPDYGQVPRQVVAPYKPHEDLEAAPLLEGAPLHISDHLPLPPADDHEYHEISDEELPVASPHFTTLDFGPSLLAEMEHAFNQISLGGTEQPPHSPADHEGTNKCNELRELSNRLGKTRKQATVKPISATDKKTLDTAIALAKDISARSMNDLESEPVPTTPVSPTKRKFSFRFPSSHEQPERRNFSEEAQSSPDLLQSTLTQEAQLAYESLVETPSPDVVVQPLFYHSTRPRSAQSENPLRLLRSDPLNVIKPRVRTFHATTQSSSEDIKKRDMVDVDETDSHRQSLDLDSNNASDDNPIPLPPRDRKKIMLTSKPRHTRKHPLIIPATSSIQRTLDKVNQLTPEDKSNEEDMPKLATEANEHCYVNHRILEDDAESIHFEAQIDSELAALDEIPEDCTLRHHVSCEDLLEFADARPSPRERGNDSDEVRIMSKVLGTDVSTEQCLLALEHSDWDVHKAIKLSKLQTLVRNSPGNLFVDLASCGNALKTANWDLTQAASFIISAHEDDITQV